MVRKKLAPALGLPSKTPPHSRVIPAHMVWAKQSHFVRAKQKFSDIKGIPDLRLFVLQSALKSVDSIPGDVAECGVRYGKSTLFMLEACERNRDFHLFDSFEGLSDPSPEDLSYEHMPTSGPRPFAQEDATATIKFLSSQDRRINIHKGWIPSEFEKVSKKRFCFVHVDVDLYQPTRDSISFFFERLEPGGILICDDYGSGHFPGARQAMDEFFSHRVESVIELPQGQGLVYKR